MTTRKQKTKAGRVDAHSDLKSAASPSSVSSSADDEFVQAPRSKRTRIARPSQTRNRKKAHRGVILPTLPLEVLHRICALVEPADLIVLAKTCGVFWRILLAPGAEAVWQSAREGCSIDVRAPPRDISELRWGVLLFGRPTCYTCKNRVNEIAYSLLRRVCASCRKTNLVHLTKWPSVLPNYDRGLADLMPYTTTGGWSRGSGHPQSRYFWLPDVHTFAQRVLTLEKDVHMRKPDAISILDEFKEEAHKRALELNTIDHEMRGWVKTLLDKQLEIEREECKAAFRNFASSLVVDGHDQRDVDQAVGCYLRYNYKKVTKIGWKKLKPGFITTVERFKETRILAQRKDRFDGMLQRIETQYNACLSALNPQLWRGQPPASAIMHIAPLAAALDVLCSTFTGDPAGEDAALATAIPLVPAALEKWAGARAEALTRAIEKGVAGRAFPRAAAAVFNVEMTTYTGAGNVGGHLWRTRPSSALLTADDVGVLHPSMFCHAWSEDPVDARAKLEPASKHVVLTMEKLLKTTGVNSCAELEERNIRAMCVICPLERDADGRLGRPVRTWRQTLEHVAEKYCMQGCEILSDTQAADVRARERFKDEHESWACAHCDEHFSVQVAYLDVVAHIKNRHGNDSPRKGKDFFWYDSLGKTVRPLHDTVSQAVDVPMAAKNRVPCTSHVENIHLSAVAVHCLWCLSGKLYGPGLESISDHLLDRHKIAKAHQKSNIDYGTENHPEIKNSTILSARADLPAYVS